MINDVWLAIYIINHRMGKRVQVLAPDHLCWIINKRRGGVPSRHQLTVFSATHGDTTKVRNILEPGGPTFSVHLIRGLTSAVEALSDCFETQMSEQSRNEDVRRTSGGFERKLTSAQNRNEGVQRMQKRRPNQPHSKNTYMPATHSSRNHSASRQTGASVRRAPSPVRRTNPVRHY